MADGVCGRGGQGGLRLQGDATAWRRSSRGERDAIPVRVFATSFEGGESKDAGTMALDATGHVVEWDLEETLFRRVE